MKTHLPALFTWLTLAALGDWLITRTIARAAIFIPKSALLLKIFSTITFSGQLATSLTSVLSILALSWIAWQHLFKQRNLALVISCAGILGVNFTGIFLPSAGWGTVSFHLLMSTGVVALTWQVWKSADDREVKLAIYSVAVTLLIGNLYQSLNSIYRLIELSGPPILGQIVFNAGEFLVLVCVAALWWAFGRGAPKRAWFLAMLPALVFVVPRLTAPAMTGIMAIWSMGLTLYLPWLLYVGAIWLISLTIINSFQRGNTAGFAVLLLTAGGIAPQMSIQWFLGLIALWILVNTSGSAQTVAPSATEYITNSQVGFHQLDGI